MNSFELDIIDEKSRAGSEFMDRVAKELRRALIDEKSTRRITQQAIADKIGTSRAVVNREVQGLENLTARRIGELFWALGWEPYFEARKIPVGDNYFQRSASVSTKPQAVAAAAPVATSSARDLARVLFKRVPQGVQINSDSTTAAQ